MRKRKIGDGDLKGKKKKPLRGRNDATPRAKHAALISRKRRNQNTTPIMLPKTKKKEPCERVEKGEKP